MRTAPFRSKAGLPIPGFRHHFYYNGRTCYWSLCMATRPRSPIDTPQPAEPRPSRDQAESAVRTLLRWAGDDPNREGLRDTPARVARAYDDWFSGYADDPVNFLQRTFEEVEGYD